MSDEYQMHAPVPPFLSDAQLDQADELQSSIGELLIASPHGGVNSVLGVYALSLVFGRLLMALKQAQLPDEEIAKHVDLFLKTTESIVQANKILDGFEIFLPEDVVFDEDVADAIEEGYEIPKNLLN